MAQTIVLRRSAQTGKVPGTSSLNLGEIAINTYDGRVFFKKSGSIESIEHILTTNSITTGSITLTKTGSFGELVVVTDGNFQRDIFVTRDIVGNGDLDIAGSLTASIANGYIWVGNASNNTALVATASIITTNTYITASATAPSIIYDNMVWYDSDTGKSYIRYNDGTSTQWVLQSDPTINVGPTLLTLQEVTDIGYTTNNPIIVTNTTNATTSGSGALIISGGAGFMMDVWARKFYGDGSGLTGVSASYTEVDTLDSVLGRGNSSANSIVLTGTTNATSKITGVIRVAGGIGISKDIWADNLVLSGTLTASLQSGYAWVGNGLGVASAVATSSFSTLLPSGLLSSSNSTFSAYTASTNSRLNNLELESASIDVSIIALNASTSALNSFSASTNISLTNHNISSASQQTSITTLNVSTSSLNTYTASVSTSVFNINLYTASVSTSIFNHNLSSGSQQTSITALNVSTSSLNTYTASVSTSVFNINLYTASVSTSVFNHNISSGSQQASISALSVSTGSLNTFTASAASRLSNLEVKSASVDVSISNNNISSASQQASITALNVSTNSLNSFTSSVNGAVIFNGSDLIVKGNFYVSGSTTYISSSTLNIGDNIIELNFGGTQTIAGIYVKDATATSLVSGSLLWDGTNDYWIAGKSGSEAKILLANSDNVLSSSINFTTYTTSVDSRLNNLQSKSASVDASINALNVSTNSLNIFTASSTSRLSNLETKSGSTDASLTNLNTYTASVSTSVFNINLYTASVSTSVLNHNISSASQQASITALNVSTGSINTFTASAVSRLSNLETKSGSVDVSIIALNVVSASLNSKTGSYATTGSNIFISNQIISGNLDLSGSFTSSLLKGYVFVGDANNRTTITPTSSFGGGGIVTYDNTFDFNLEPFVGVIGYIESANLLNRVYANNENIIFQSSNIGFATFTTSSSYISSSFTASLQQGYVWVGNADGKSIAFSTSSLVAGGSSFGTVAVSGQTDVVADVANDTLTLIAGTNVSITTNATGDSITINATGGGSGDTSALNASTASLNTFTASAASRFANLEIESASVDASIVALNVSTGTLNVYTASVSTSVFNINLYTASVSTSVFNHNLSSGSQLASISALSVSTGSLNTFTASAASRLLNLESKSASVDVSVIALNISTGSLNTYTASVSTSVFNHNLSSGSQQASISALSVSTGSINIFTASAASRLSNLETKSASVDVSISTLNVSTASLNSKTGSYATTGSNTFIGNQLISGALDVSQSISSSLPQGHVLVGNGVNRTVVVATSSFGGGQTTDITALNVSTQSLNTFTASAASRFTNLEIESASVDVSIITLNVSSGALNVFTASTVSRLTNLEIESRSIDVSIFAINASTASLSAATSSYARLSGGNTFAGLQIISGALDVSQSISSSLPQGHVLVGNGINRTVVVATSSFAGSGGGLKTKAGSVANTSFTGNPKKATITFATAFTDTNYAISITGEDARSWTIESKVAASFVINANSNTSLVGTTYWTATAYGETV